MNSTDSSKEVTGTTVAGSDWLTPGRFAAILALLIFATNPGVILGWSTFYYRDFGFYGYPLAHYYRESFWRGEIPLWNPYSNCGLPFLAQWNTMTLYPGSLFYLLFPLPWSLGVFCLLHQFLAGLGMYRLADNWTGHRLGAAVAGLVFAFNGMFVNCIMSPNNIATLAWMPWVVMLVERGWQKGGYHMVLGAMTAALQVLAGGPENIALTWLIIAAVFLFQCGEHARPRGIMFGRLILMLIGVAALTTVQMLPFLDLLHHSQRDAAFAKDDWPMPPTGWANFLVPLFRCYENKDGTVFQYGQYWTSSYYLGAGTLVLALMGLLRRRERRVLLLGVVTAAGLVLSLGEHGHVYNWARVIFPPLGFIRYPIKFVALVAFCVPLLAAHGMRWCGEVAAGDATRFRSLVSRLTLLLLGLMAAIVWFGHAFPLGDHNWPLLWRSGATRTVFLIAAVVSLWLLWRGPTAWARWFAQCLFLLVLSTDLSSHIPSPSPTTIGGVFTPRLSRPGLTRQPALGSDRAMISPPAEQFFRYLFSGDRAGDYLLSRRGLFSNCNLLENMPKVDGFFPLYLRDSGGVVRMLYDGTNSPSSGVLDFLGISHTTLPGKYWNWGRRPDHLPIVTGGQRPLFASERETLAFMARPDFNPREVVYLPPEAGPSIAVTNGAEVLVRSVRFGDHQIEMEYSAIQPAMLVIAQAYYHPWQVYVDGRPERLYRANVGFQAAQIPEGTHKIQLRYEDRAFGLGAIVSGSGWSLCGAYLLRHVLRSRRHRIIPRFQ